MASLDAITHAGPAVQSSPSGDDEWVFALVPALCPITPGPLQLEGLAQLCLTQVLSGRPGAVVREELRSGVPFVALRGAEGCGYGCGYACACVAVPTIYP